MNHQVKLEDSLLKVFPLAPAPKDIFNSSSSFGEYDEELKAEVLGKTWNQVRDDFWVSSGLLRTMNRYSLTPQAAYYYFPSVIKEVIRSPESIEDLTCLILPSKIAADWWESFFGCFDDKQKELLIDCIAFFDSYYSERYNDWYSSTQEYSDLNLAFEAWSKS